MDLFTALFWIGILVILVSHILLFNTMQRHSITTLVALGCVFVGSKIGRKFLGIE